MVPYAQWKRVDALSPRLCNNLEWDCAEISPMSEKSPFS
jgi:hypothetical protein